MPNFLLSCQLSLISFLYNRFQRLLLLQNSKTMARLGSLVQAPINMTMLGCLKLSMA